MRVKVSPRDERGATLVFVAISMFVLLALAALSVDFGVMFAQRRGMVNANDAGAMAFAQSCALHQSDADYQADALAKANVGSAARNGPPAWPVDGSCPGRGSVEVKYVTQQKLVFAPAIGLGSQQIGAKATAAWGPAGGAGNLLPTMVSLGRLSTCNIPTVPGTECWFYANNGNQGLGNASWSFLNVQQACSQNQFGWDVRVARCNKVKNPEPTYNCPSWGDSALRDIIDKGSGPLSLNSSGVTYVCNVTGGHNASFQDIQTLVGQTRLFPVNDPNKQIFNGGTPAPPNVTPDFYAIVGFIQLKIVDVYRGNQSWDSRCPGTRDANAWCLHAIWAGFDTEPGPICDACLDFGVGAIALRG
jgi:Flp pilus assembly protein TadG